MSAESDKTNLICLFVYPDKKKIILYVAFPKTGIFPL